MRLAARVKFVRCEWSEVIVRDQREQAVIDAEVSRCRAIAEGDMAKLAALLSDDYLHVHGDGRVGDKADYIEGVERAPRVPVRSNLVVRLFGDIAVLTGDLLNTIEFPDREKLVIDTFATFVLREQQGKWAFVSGQLTPKRMIV
jgi:ketosteroid isomerase-like protein